MDIVLALAAALLFALGTVLQQKAGLDEPSDGASSSLLPRMARSHDNRVSSDAEQRQRRVWHSACSASASGGSPRDMQPGRVTLAIGILWLLLTALSALSYSSADIDSIKGLGQRGAELLFGGWLVLLGIWTEGSSRTGRRDLAPAAEQQP